MSTIITNAFSRYWQACLTNQKPVVLDEFVLANVPGLNLKTAIDPNSGLPLAKHIVYRQAVDQRGRINNNAVAYSIVMDTTVGDFSFNAMYLINKASGMVGMIVHKGLETKLKTNAATGQTGNSLVKSMLMEYEHAAAATVTQVDAGTWQIDYAARLRGMDDDLRLQALQFFGPATFYGNGFKLVNESGIYKVQPGVAYVGGLRAQLDEVKKVSPSAKPVGLWLDIYRAGSLLDVWVNHFTLTLSVPELTDYQDANGYQHHVAKVAIVNSDGSVTDVRRKRTIELTGDVTGKGVLEDAQGVRIAVEIKNGSHRHVWSELDKVPATASRWPSWTEVTGKPALATAKHRHQWSDLDEVPAQASRWPRYDEVTDKPALAAATHRHPWSQLDQVPATALRWPSWAEVTSKPALAAANHTHPGSALNPIDLGGTDLNTIITPGFYAQHANINATSARNYPEQLAGSLIVTSGAGVQQRYHVYNTSRVWTRAQYHTGAFTPWAREFNTLNPPTPAQSGAAPANHTHPAAQGNADIVAGGYGQVGTYVLASNISGATKGIGATVPGSSLVPASAGERHQDAARMAGTWKCLGFSFGSGGPFDTRITLWIRIA